MLGGTYRQYGGAQSVPTHSQPKLSLEVWHTPLL